MKWLSKYFEDNQYHQKAQELYFDNSSVTRLGRQKRRHEINLTSQMKCKALTKD